MKLKRRGIHRFDTFSWLVGAFREEGLKVILEEGFGGCRFGNRCG